MKQLMMVLAATIAAVGCAKDLRPKDDPDGGTGPGPGHIMTTNNADGTFTLVIDASSETEWIYLDFETQKEVTPATPETSSDWDIAFQRFRVKTNGGISGAGMSEVAALPNTAFAGLTEAPSGPYVVDAVDSMNDPDMVPDFAFNVPNSASELGWYQYEATTHILMPADVTYVVRSAQGNYFKIRFLDYYDTAGSPGYLKLDLGMVGAPANNNAMMVDVSGMGYVRISLANRAIVTVGNSNTSAEWDLGVDEAAWQTNSGGMRVGKGGSKLAPAGASYDAITEATTIGFKPDEMLPFPGPPGSGNFLGSRVLLDWFTYDEMSHTATSKGLVYLIRTAAGDYGKMQIVRYDNATKIYTVRLDPVMKKVATASASIDASDRGSFAHFNLRTGTAVAADGDWDIAFSGVRVKTNSGTSGSGMGGALDPGAGSLDEITMAPSDGYVPDAMIADPEGMGDYSGNSVLAGWYTFETATGTTAKDAAYLVRTANGDYAKLKVRSWDDGRFVIDWAYAGPEETSF